MAYEIGEDIFRFPRYSAALEQDLCRASRDEILDIQTRRMRLVLDYCWEKMPFYRNLWEEAGVSPGDIRTSEDIVKLPTWDKELQRTEIRTKPPYGSYFVDSETKNIAFLLSSGGTTGEPRMLPILKTDLPGIQDIVTRTMQFIGVTENDIVHTSSPYSAFAGPWCATWAVEGVGAALVPASSGKALASTRQVDLIRRMKATVLRMQPSYAERLAKVAVDMGFDPSTFNVRTVIIAGEAYSKEKRARIEKAWNAKVYDFFGSSDTFSWSSVDCEHSQSLLGEPGMHVWEDACIIEVLDENQKPCPPGKPGELTLTTFNWRNSPRIRFRTGDLVTVHNERCGCGRNLARMSAVLGRVDHVVRIKGVNIYPIALDATVSAADPRIREFYAVAKREDDQDVLEVTIEWPQPDDEEFRSKVQSAIRNGLGLAPRVTLAEIGSTLQRTGVEGERNKTQRLFDER